MPAARTAYDYFPIVFSVAAVIVAVSIVIAIILVARQHRSARSADREPMLSYLDTSAPAHASTQLGAESTEERLRELDELDHRRAISPEEYVRARSKALDGNGA
ncbi:hypothetical protein [Subtercola boreus]|uniref:SHOCT domain-containing protein n=1 Tax=Subtercola boreus TaxID=120213 RepID=A0A3E0WEL5_9MICO|nr:hypothetical protein [Subtercola boreus]RFA22013.1 hypothetical protein B7R24_04815 [Subtercola boreus]RFA22193.1 hypothetical protein B7R23_04760 [Subtercola boreus]RFA28055.1 hypothetical protein B7R25_04885 [Subtercola boreus]